MPSSSSSRRDVAASIPDYDPHITYLEDDGSSTASTISPHLRCPICLSPFQHPSTLPCTHTFCRSCIAHALKDRPRCPTCRLTSRLSHIQPAPPLVRNLVDSLRVCCVNARRGCEHTCERQHLAMHVRRDCAFIFVGEYEERSAESEERVLPRKKRGACCECGAKVLRRDITAHQKECVVEWVRCEEDGCGAMLKLGEVEAHAQTCEKITTPCPHCKSPETRASLPAHLDLCDFAEITCPHARWGCVWRGLRSSMHRSSKDGGHLEHCTLAPLAPMLERLDDEMNNLRTDNEEMRQRLARIEGEGRAMGDVAKGCRSSLGDWYIGPRDEREAEEVWPSDEEPNDVPSQATVGEFAFPSSIETDSSAASLSTSAPRLRRPASQSSSRSQPAHQALESTRWPELVSPDTTTRSRALSTHSLPNMPNPSSPEHRETSFSQPSPEPARSSPLSTHLSHLTTSLHALSTSLATLEHHSADERHRSLTALFDSGRALEELASCRGALHAVRMQVAQCGFVVQALQMQRGPGIGGGVAFGALGLGRSGAELGQAGKESQDEGGRGQQQQPNQAAFAQPHSLSMMRRWGLDHNKL